MSFRLQTYSDLRTFAEEACPFLLKDEARNNLQLGLVRHALKDPSFAFDFTATVESPTGQVTGVLTRTPGRSLVLSTLPIEAHEAVVQTVWDALPSLIGVLGPSDTVRILASELAKRFGKSAVRHTHYGILTLRAVTRPAPTPGSFKTAQPEHLPVVLEWMSLFHEELPAMGAPPAAPSTERRVRAEEVFLWFDEKSEPVSMALRVRDSPHGGIIGYVYTPKDRRGLGFGSNCVAHASQAILDEGKEFCGLYVDLTNPISIRMYSNLGYDLIGESNEMRFAPLG
jgi:hypothetical protein